MTNSKLSDKEAIDWLADIHAKAAMWNARHSDADPVKITIEAEEFIEHQRLVYTFMISDPVDIIVSASHDDFKKTIELAKEQWESQER